jgi:hypothetical protein
MPPEPDDVARWGDEYHTAAATSHAIEVVARHLLASGRYDTDDPGSCWEDYPDIGENDWTAVERCADRLYEQWLKDIKPADDIYQTAYTHLSERAERNTA